MSEGYQGSHCLNIDPHKGGGGGGGGGGERFKCLGWGYSDIVGVRVNGQARVRDLP